MLVNKYLMLMLWIVLERFGHHLLSFSCRWFATILIDTPGQM
jgi:hypothetical protein